MPFHAVGEKYINAVRDVAGAVPLLIPVTREPLDIAQILAVVDGIFLPGSPSNVAPEIYGGPPPRADNHADPQRDALTLPLIRALRLGSDQDQQRLRDLLTSSDGDDRARLRDEPIVRQGVESAHSTAEHFVRRALRNLESLPSCPAREILALIAQFAIQRTG